MNREFRTGWYGYQFRKEPSPPLSVYVYILYSILLFVIDLNCPSPPRIQTERDRQFRIQISEKRCLGEGNNRHSARQPSTVVQGGARSGQAHLTTSQRNDPQLVLFRLKLDKSFCFLFTLPFSSLIRWGTEVTCTKATSEYWNVICLQRSGLDTATGTKDKKTTTRCSFLPSLERKRN